MRCFVISLKSEKMIGKYEAERISQLGFCWTHQFNIFFRRDF